jgi:hypothetical protein
MTNINVINDDDFSELDNNEQLTEFEQMCNELLQKITNNYREQKNDVRNILKQYHKEIKMTKKIKPIKKEKEKTGFTKPATVPDKLAKFVGIEVGTVMPRTELTALICKEFKKRNLYYAHDKRVIIPDNDVIMLFNLPKNAEKSTNPKDPNGLNFYNLQKYIAKCYEDYNKQKNNIKKPIAHKIN